MSRGTRPVGAGDSRGVRRSRLRRSAIRRSSCRSSGVSWSAAPTSAASCLRPTPSSSPATRTRARPTFLGSRRGSSSPRWQIWKGRRSSAASRLAHSRAKQSAAGDWRLTGEKDFVVAGIAADLLVVSAMTRTRPKPFRRRRHRDGVTQTAAVGHGPDASSSPARVSRQPSAPAGRAGRRGCGCSPGSASSRRSRMASEQAGAAERCLEMSVELREDALSVRPSDRVVPGHQTPARRHAARGRGRQIGGPLRRAAGG